MDTKLPKKKNPVLATDEQIIAAYKELQNISQVSRKLHVGGERASRILKEAGFHIKRSNSCKIKFKKERIPEKYIEAIDAYHRGAPMMEIARKYRITYAHLYRWIDAIGVKRRDSQDRSVKTDWHCRECGNKAPYGELFCSDKHRRIYGAAAIRPGFKPPRYYRQETNEP